MAIQFEAAKGAVEQVLSTRSPIVMRVLLPGTLATVMFYPTVYWILGRLLASGEQSWLRLLVLAAVVVAAGEFISVLSDEVYKIYEGRIFWPRSLLKWGLSVQNRRLRRLLAQANRARAENDLHRYDETWYQLRLYSLDDNSEPQVERPTLLGNILAGYEQYPKDRYGMDPVFYWPRIWLEVETEKKEQIDNRWCVADGLLLLSAVGMAGGVLWLLEAAAGLFIRFTIPLRSPLWAALVSPGWWIAGYAFYRLSLPHHRANGELFKSIFDLYRAKVWELTTLRPHEKEAWDAA
jgi:hypothetical protein